MMNSKMLVAAASGALLLSTVATAQVQGQQQQQQSDILSQMLGAMFGNNQQASEQTLETDWNRGGRPFEQRRAGLESRIDTAVREGSLTRGEADQIRREYDDIVRLEAQYAANGSYSQAQRDELRSRYRALTQRVGGTGYGQGNNQCYGQGYGQQDGRWQPMSTRNYAFERRVDAGLRNRTLTQAQATRLRADWRTLAQVEASYQRGGIDAREQDDLWARYYAIDSRLGGLGNDRNTARWSQMENRLVTAERNGRISRNDAVAMRAQLGDLTRLDAAYAADGYSADQRQYLMQRCVDLDGMLGFSRR